MSHVYRLRHRQLPAMNVQNYTLWRTHTNYSDNWYLKAFIKLDLLLYFSGIVEYKLLCVSL